jgi:hypothetical protein
MSIGPLPSSGRFVKFTPWKGPEITDDLMEACATLFSNNYGIWSPQVPQKKLEGKF